VDTFNNIIGRDCKVRFGGNILNFIENESKDRKPATSLLAGVTRVKLVCCFLYRHLTCKRRAWVNVIS